MDKTFWLSLRESDFALPPGRDIGSLTAELFSHLSSLDPELRDDIAYVTYANWLKQGQYPLDQIRVHVTRLFGNLQHGLGERESDSVFLRSFSALFLAEITHNNNKKPQFEPHETAELLNHALAYLAAERDPRGFVPVKGWAHALAHTADWLMVLAKNPHLDAASLLRILEGISTKLKNSTDWVYLHGEDDRLSNAVLSVFKRGLVPAEQVKAWLAALSADWQGAWMDEARTRAFFNVRNFLRAVHLALVSTDDFPQKNELQVLLLETLENLQPY
ncbi:MAG: DUF2785 domain-containing protein [Chloroflexi bacterium]|nr:DUF2785 domain-containing protein [Chloroflexota bacterium]